MLHDGSYNFSFSGLKTSALYWLKEHKLSSVIASEASQSPENKADSDSKVISKMSGIATSPDIGRGPRNDVSINDFCASFEQAITDVLVGKTMRAVEKFKPKTVILAGGVSANKKLRETLESEIKNYSSKIKFLRPEPKYCMDNAAMIAVAGYARITKETNTSWREINADPNWEIEE
jgi:tRNA A37 threonylcarbamoyltransferase TsaD